MRVYEESTGDVARLRGGEKAERSEESALFKLLSGCFCFVLFYVLLCVVVSLSLVSLLLSFASLAQEYYYYSLTYSISARSRGFYRANKNSILSVKKNVLTHTHTYVCALRVCENFHREHLVEL